MSNYFDNKISPVALSFTNRTFHDQADVLIQELENPFGRRFHVATLKKSYCAETDHSVSTTIFVCLLQECWLFVVSFFFFFQKWTDNNGYPFVVFSQWSHSYTWFPGYSWKICFCPKCSSHLGWMFEPNESAISTLKEPTQAGFYAIVANSVIGETCKTTAFAFNAYVWYSEISNKD